MSDPTRLLQDRQVGSATAELLRALKPPQAAPPEVKAALSQQLAGLVAQGAAPAAAVASGVWLKASLLALAVVGSGAAVWRLQSTPAAAPAPVVVEPPVAKAPPAALPSAAPAPVVVEPPAARPRAPVVSSASAEPRDKLAEEEALLEEARSLLGASPARALGLLSRHKARFPGGQLAAERMYLSVDCLRRLGRQAEAQREVDALVARYPNSAYARRAPLLLSAPAPKR